jgi:hypothetical protein
MIDAQNAHLVALILTFEKQYGQYFSVGVGGWVRFNLLMLFIRKNIAIDTSRKSTMLLMNKP